MRIFGAYQNFNWEEPNLTPALQSFGDLVRYDWHAAHGYDQYDPAWHYGGKQSMNAELVAQVYAAHQERPLDVFYGYLCGRLVFRGMIEAIKLLGVPTLTMCLDDKTHRYSALEPTGFAGMVDVASAFDLCWTSDPTAVAWYESIGARAIYLPPGANPDVFVPQDCERDIDVLFIGKNYGRRAEIIGALTDAGIDVTCYGQGWPRGPVTTEQMVNLMNRAKITLGIGETADPERLSLKGRDFEAPMCGAFYLCQHNDELAAHYALGHEIQTWNSVGEMAEMILYFSRYPELAEDIRHAGAIRARRDHTWRARFEAAFRALGVYE